MIIDVFPFLDEVDLAELRIRYLSNTVDLFVVSEFDHGFSGERKQFCFPKVIDRLPRYLKNKVRYFPQKQRRIFSNTFENDRFQKDSISEILFSLCELEDIIIFGDLDEIPNRITLQKILRTKSAGNFYHFAQLNFLGFLNVIETSDLILSHAGEFSNVARKKWLGSISTDINTLCNISMTDLRDPNRKEISVRISEGGWHFSFCGGENANFHERFRKKMKFSAHQEFNNDFLLSKAFHNLEKGKDPFDRKFTRKFGPVTVIRSPKFRILEGLNHLPIELAQLCNYPNLILHK